jgi:hypothetical protein
MTVETSAEETGEKPVQITGTFGLEGGPRPDYVAYAFVFPGNIIS